MGLETGNLPDDLNTAWPLAGDPTSQGDDHLRLVKVVVDNWAGTWGNGQVDTLAKAYADAAANAVQANVDTNTADIATLQTDKADLDGAALLNATLDGNDILTDANYAAKTNTIFATTTVFPADTGKLVEASGAVAISGSPVTGNRMDVFNGSGGDIAVTGGTFKGFGTSGTTLTISDGLGASVIYNGTVWLVIGSGAIT